MLSSGALVRASRVRQRELFARHGRRQDSGLCAFHAIIGLPLPSADNKQASGESCCDSCRATPGCNAWVWCGAAAGCSQGSRPQGECWLKKAGNPAMAVYNWMDVRPMPSDSPRRNLHAQQT